VIANGPRGWTVGVDQGDREAQDSARRIPYSPVGVMEMSSSPPQSGHSLGCGETVPTSTRCR
jgi:hypothetical protein